MPRTNLDGDFIGNTCRYYTVTDPFPVYLLRGHTESNTYIGNSMMLACVWQHAHLPVGTQIQALPGGQFAVLDGMRVTAHIKLGDKHPFEKTYGAPPVDIWPVEKLQEVPAEQAVDVQGREELGRFTRQEVSKLGATLQGRGIDYVIEKELSANGS